jgi:hypothetical protein
MSAFVMLAGLAYNPHIAGILIVATGVVVLIGSVWLLLATNSGIRVGTLLAVTALMGWMFIMGSTWWMYGKGWQGNSPAWITVDINVGDLGRERPARARQDLPTLRDPAPPLRKGRVSRRQPRGPT